MKVFRCRTSTKRHSSKLVADYSDSYVSHSGRAGQDKYSVTAWDTVGTERYTVELSDSETEALVRMYNRVQEGKS